MQKTNLSAAVTSSIAMESVDQEGATTPLDAEFTFNPNDPYAVSVLFKTETAPVTWTFARDLLINGTYEPTGDGDVLVWPCVSAEGTAVVIIELYSPSGEVLIQAGGRDIRKFVDAMMASVPLGEESAHIDIDAALQQLLSA